MIPYIHAFIYMYVCMFVCFYALINGGRLIGIFHGCTEVLVVRKSRHLLYNTQKKKKINAKLK